MNQESCLIKNSIPLVFVYIFWFSLLSIYIERRGMERINFHSCIKVYEWIYVGNERKRILYASHWFSSSSFLCHFISGEKKKDGNKIEWKWKKRGEKKDETKERKKKERWKWNETSKFYAEMNFERLEWMSCVAGCVVRSKKRGLFYTQKILVRGFSLLHTVSRLKESKNTH